MATQSVQEWYAQVPRSARIPTLAGFFVLAFTVSGFAYWGATAPIAGAVIAAGAFVATGENKVIQHLEGGIIREILVSEGDLVRSGQTLIHLDETGPRTNLSRLRLRHAHLEATQARLTAQAAGATEIAFPDHLLAERDSPEVADILRAQQGAFDAHQNQLQAEIAVLESGIEAFQERIAGGEVQLKSIHAQLGFIEEELQAKSSLLKAGLIRKPEVLSFQRAQANLEGEIGRITAEMGDWKERIARIAQEVASVRKSAVRSAVDELHKVGAELVDLQEQMRSAREVLSRTEIKAPVDGVVVKLAYHTAGGVIGAGDDIMVILPAEAELIIEVRVQPADIDNVSRGQHAVVRLAALNQRITPMVDGEVIYVSADSLPSRQGEAMGDVYVARIKLDPAKAALVQDFNPTPGMPAEVYINTSERTFFEYLVQPLRDSMTRAFREP